MKRTNRTPAPAAAKVAAPSVSSAAMGGGALSLPALGSWTFDGQSVLDKAGRNACTKAHGPLIAASPDMARALLALVTDADAEAGGYMAKELRAYTRARLIEDARAALIRAGVVAGQSEAPAPGDGGSFAEITYTGEDDVEVMAHRDTASGEILRIYTYARDCDTLDAMRGETPSGKARPGWTWEEGRNPLFRHLATGQVRRFVAELIESGELVTSDEDEAGQSEGKESGK